MGSASSFRGGVSFEVPTAVSNQAAVAFQRGGGSRRAMEIARRLIQGKALGELTLRSLLSWFDRHPNPLPGHEQERLLRGGDAAERWLRKVLGKRSAGSVVFGDGRLLSRPLSGRPISPGRYVVRSADVLVQKEVSAQGMPAYAVVPIPLGASVVVGEDGLAKAFWKNRKGRPGSPDRRQEIGHLYVPRDEALAEALDW
jgi:hypothetical protein